MGEKEIVYHYCSRCIGVCVAIAAQQVNSLPVKIVENNKKAEIYHGNYRIGEYLNLCLIN